MIRTHYSVGVARHRPITTTRQGAYSFTYFYIFLFRFAWREIYISLYTNICIYLLKVNIYIQNFVYRLSEPRNTHTHSTSYSPPSIILYIHSSIISPPSTISTPTFYIPIFYDSFSLRSLSLPHLGNSHIYVTLHSKTSILCDHLIKFRLRHSA